LAVHDLVLIVVGALVLGEDAVELLFDGLELLNDEVLLLLDEGDVLDVLLALIEDRGGLVLDLLDGLDLLDDLQLLVLQLLHPFVELVLVEEELLVPPLADDLQRLLPYLLLELRELALLLFEVGGTLLGDGYLVGQWLCEGHFLGVFLLRLGLGLLLGLLGCPEEGRLDSVLLLGCCSEKSTLVVLSLLGGSSEDILC